VTHLPIYKSAHVSLKSCDRITINELFFWGLVAIKMVIHRWRTISAGCDVIARSELEELPA
jgi:hypothetical protein